MNCGRSTTPLVIHGELDFLPHRPGILLTPLVRNGWGASAADALSTAIIMGEKEIVHQILDYVPTINWAVSADDELVSLFETTIRYLGGLLSGYDLLTGPAKELCEDVS
jgi:mannosyl-oligosaccharide alpha-1,2-mannosidase